MLTSRNRNRLKKSLQVGSYEINVSNVLDVYLTLVASYTTNMWSILLSTTIVIYDSRVVWLDNCPYYDFRVVIYAHKMFIRLATDTYLNALGISLTRQGVTQSILVIVIDLAQQQQHFNMRLLRSSVSQ